MIKSGVHITKLILHGLIIVSIALISSCSATKTLHENEFLYTKSEIDITGPDNIESKLLKRLLKTHVVPRQNTKMFGLFPVKLWIYSMAWDSSLQQKPVKRWIITKLGEPPVVFKEYYKNSTQEQFEQFLINKGFFHNQVTVDKETNNKKLKVYYHINLHEPYFINQYKLTDTTSEIGAFIDSVQNKSLLKKGKKYDLQLLKDERQRIYSEARNAGYFYFSDSYLLFQADTFDANNQINLTLTFKQGTQKSAFTKYYINNVFIHHQMHSSEDDAPDTLISQGIYHIYQNQLRVAQHVINRSVFLNKGDLYTMENHRRTLDKLNSLGVFSFVNSDFEPDNTAPDSLLNVHFYLSELKPKTIRTELQTVTKSNDYTGPALIVRFQNRNVKGKANQLEVNQNAGFETQLNKKNQGNAYEFGSQLKFDVPKILFPGIDLNSFISQRFTPQTSILVGYNHFRRINLINVNSFNLSFGYNWRETQTKQHQLNLWDINYLSLSEVDESLQENSFFIRNYQEQFISALNYTYQLNNLMKNRRFNHFFKGNAELAGNFISLLDNSFSKQESDKGVNDKFLGLSYAQFARFSIDYRNYLHMVKDQNLVSRIFFGIGIPYGNSTKLPYNRQFFSGGTSSLRAFPYRSVGPGTYQIPDSLSNVLLTEQSGDIKLELNLEYRFNIVKFFKGAFFMDAGNVWLIKNDEQVTGGKFNSDEFYRQIALGSGVGLRFDLNLFVIRFDVAYPIYDPAIQSNEKWFENLVNFKSKYWRKNNIVYNFAIGYPF